MKPTVPGRGRVIKLEGDMAVVLLHSEKSCKGCGAAAIGLCKPSGGISTLTIKNAKHAVPGDTVTVALDKKTQRTGFLLAYGIPIIFFLLGSFLGYVASAKFSIPSLDVPGGFIFLVISAAWSLTRLRKLDRSSSLVVKEIVSHKHF